MRRPASGLPVFNVESMGWGSNAERRVDAGLVSVDKTLELMELTGSTRYNTLVPKVMEVVFDAEFSESSDRHGS